jgi:glycosyltransferase involved in cell wall biosynthesis
LWRALTETEGEQIRAVVGGGARVVVAPNGLDLAPMKLTLFPRPSGRRRALFLGRLHPKKGLELLIRAWADSRSAAKEWELLIAGPDEGNHEAQVRRWVADAGLTGSVTFAGPVSGAAKFELIATADLFVLTSYSEGVPMAPLEAMGSAVPVAITRQCNLPEVTSAGAGWVCNADFEETRNMLREALSANDDERKQRGMAGRRLVERTFAWQKTVATIQEACQQIA